MSVDYHAIGAAIVTHLQTELDSDVYLVTQDISAALSQTKVPVSVCVLFSGFAWNETLSYSSGGPTDDVTYLIGIVARAESATAQDVLIDAGVSAIRSACSNPGHGFPIFAYTTILLERSVVVSAGPKTLVEQKGLTIPMTVEVRIMEE